MLSRCLLLVLLFSASLPASAADINADMLEGLKPFAGVVGTWKGSGISPKSPGWSEKITGGWGFREKDGRVALELFIDEGKFLEAALITYDPAEKMYGFVTRDTAKKLMHFRGRAAGENILRLDRVEEGAKDDFDRVEVKLLQGGDKLLYAFSKRVGRNFFEMHTQVESRREGPSLDEFAAGPFCVVTGGAGWLEVVVNGKSYPVACEACRDELLAHPDKYVKP